MPSRRPDLASTVASFGAGSSLGIFHTFNSFNFTAAIWLSTFTDSLLRIALLASYRSLVGAVVAPLIRTWPGRTWLPWLGWQRPFRLAGGRRACAVSLRSPGPAMRC